MAAAPRAAQWFTAADGTRHPLIEISSDSSDDEVAAGGSCGTLASLDPAAALAGDASERDEREWDPAVAGAWNSDFIYVIVNILLLLCPSRMASTKRAPLNENHWRRLSATSLADM